MTKQAFELFWGKNYPESPPVNHLFKHNLSDRWLRIHSLPDDKRYAETTGDWAILKARQHTVFTDLLPKTSKTYLVTMQFGGNETPILQSFKPKNRGFQRLAFTKLTPINYFEITQLYVDEGLILTPFFAEIEVGGQLFDDILKAIAMDQLRAFFVNPANNCLIAPYDGGVDLILENTISKNRFEKKYKNWLPK